MSSAKGKCPCEIQIKWNETLTANSSTVNEFMVFAFISSSSLLNSSYNKLTFYILETPKHVLLHTGNNVVARTLEKDTHIKERLLDQTVILFNCVPFQNGNLLLKERICSQKGRILSFKSSSWRYGNHLYHIRWSPWNVTIFITHVHNCVMGATPMVTTQMKCCMMLHFIRVCTVCLDWNKHLKDRNTQ